MRPISDKVVTVEKVGLTKLVDIDIKMGRARIDWRKKEVTSRTRGGAK